MSSTTTSSEESEQQIALAFVNGHPGHDVNAHPGIFLTACARCCVELPRIFRAGGFDCGGQGAGAGGHGHHESVRSTLILIGEAVWRSTAPQYGVES